MPSGGGIKLKIIVLIKEVPDTWGDRRLSLETGLADRRASESVLDEIGERAIEVALSYADTEPETEVVVMSMAPEFAAVTIRKGLAMGATAAIQIADEAIRGADLSFTAEVLAAALRKEGFDLIIAGNQSTDGVGGVLPAMIAEHLAVPQLTGLVDVTIEPTRVSGRRVSDLAVSEISAELPAVIAITEALPAGRLPSFKGIMAAKKKPYQTLALDDLGIDGARLDVPRSIMTAIAERAPRTPGVKIVDDGDAGRALAAFLRDNRLVEE